VIWFGDGCPPNVAGAGSFSRIVHSSFCITPKGSPVRAAGAFTLLEVLLSIAIISLLAGVLVAGAAHLLREQPGSSHEVFWQAVQEARKTALKAEHDIRLKFDKEKKQFVLIDGLAPTTLSAEGFTREETPLKQFPITSAGGADLTVEFLGPVTKGGNMILVGGVLLESQTIPFVTFYSDGTCSAFRAQFVRGGGTSILNVDPWTCAPILTPNDANASPP
jgi:general secretion pathway protein H